MDEEEAGYSMKEMETKNFLPCDKVVVSLLTLLFIHTCRANFLLASLECIYDFRDSTKSI